MAFDPAVHTIDRDTGFLIDKKLGHRVGLDSTPVAAPDPEQEWPKWVVPHADHVVRGKDVPPVTPALGQCAVRRGDGEVTVLVNNADEEAIATGAPRAAADPVELQPHQQRVVEEQNSLTEKIGKLASFIGGDIFDALPVDEQDRLGRQWKAMKDYAGVLAEQIGAFPAAEREPPPAETVRGVHPEERYGLDYNAKHLADSPKEEIVEPQVPVEQNYLGPVPVSEPNPAPVPPKGV